MENHVLTCSDIVPSQVFDLLKKTHGPDIMKKVVVVAGDVMLPNLGISEEDSKLLHNSVEIFYHCAATIRFDEPLKSAVLLNARGTKYALEFGSKMKCLEVRSGAIRMVILKYTRWRRFFPPHSSSCMYPRRIVIWTRKSYTKLPIHRLPIRIKSYVLWSCWTTN